MTMKQTLLNRTAVLMTIRAITTCWTSNFRSNRNMSSAYGVNVAYATSWSIIVCTTTLC